MKKLILIVMALMLLCPITTFAASKTVTVTWTCNTESDLAGYTLWTYIGTATTPTSTANIPHVAGMVCTKDATVVIPDNAVTQVCVDMDAYDSSQNHSAKSLKPCVTIDLQGPMAPTNVKIVVQ